MLIVKKRIIETKQIKQRNEVFELIADNLFGSNIIRDKQELVEKLIERENIVSTGFEQGIAIPHAKIVGLQEPIISIVKTNDINWPSMDNTPTNFVICILVPADGGDIHLKILSSLTRNLVKPEFLDQLLTGTPDTIVNLINSVGQEAVKDVFTSNSKRFYLGVTKCTVGIAHTYMAAEKLENTAKELGYKIKVETQGSVGIENRLTPQDIVNCVGIIVAADVAIEETHRFNGKKVLTVPIKEALNNPFELFTTVENAKIHTEESQSTSNTTNMTLIQHMLNGVSHMIPFVVVGGLLIALSLSFGGTPTSEGMVVQEATFWFTMLSIGTIGFNLMIPILAGYIAFSMAGRAALAPAMIGAMVANDPTILKTEAGTGFIGAIVVGLLAGYLVRYMNTWNVKKELKPVMPIFVIPLISTLLISFAFILFLGKPIDMLMSGLNDILLFLSTHTYLQIVLGIFLGGMVAADMGGPINKVAFLFAVAAIPTNPEIMGAVAAAIAVPPLSMGLASQIGRTKFTQEEQATGIAALLMGLIGITEGAIPFAAADPKRVIPSIMVGSMVASTLSLMFSVTNMVPHGGPIVGFLGATNHFVLYILSILAGTIVSCMMVLALKKK